MIAKVNKGNVHKRTSNATPEGQWISLYSSFNPLMPELNPSEQCCLPELFTGDFKF